jgi:hypothetical protein
MAEVDQDIDRMAATRRPADRPIGHHRWRNLLFVHWRVPPAEIAPLIPRPLAVDTYDGSAWIGLVPFHICGLRPWWSPPVWGISSFHETNVRTYVHWRGQDPGVWFFSLDAANSLAVTIARWRWRLPYYRAHMQLLRSGSKISYASERSVSGGKGPRVDLEAAIGEPINSAGEGAAVGHALPGTFEHFLVERYLLYAQGPNQSLTQGRVYHTPYPLRTAKIRRLEETLVEPLGLAPRSAPDHVLFSEGVDVDIFRLRPLTPA